MKPRAFECLFDIIFLTENIFLYEEGIIPMFETFVTVQNLSS